MIKTKDEIITSIKNKFNDDLSDENIAFLEDVTDTLTDLENKVKGDGIDWKAKCTEVENTWKQKYIDRFSADIPSNENENEPIIKENKRLSFEDLFEEGE